MDRVHFKFKLFPDAIFMLNFRPVFRFKCYMNLGWSFAKTQPLKIFGQPLQNIEKWPIFLLCFLLASPAEHIEGHHLSIGQR
eukprot:UN16926